VRSTNVTRLTGEKKGRGKFVSQFSRVSGTLQALASKKNQLREGRKKRRADRLPEKKNTDLDLGAGRVTTRGRRIQKRNGKRSRGWKCLGTDMFSSKQTKFGPDIAPPLAGMFVAMDR